MIDSVLRLLVPLERCDRYQFLTLSLLKAIIFLLKPHINSTCYRALKLTGTEMGSKTTWTLRSKCPWPTGKTSTGSNWWSFSTSSSISSPRLGWRPWRTCAQTQGCPLPGLATNSTFITSRKAGQHVPFGLVLVFYYLLISITLPRQAAKVAFPLTKQCKQCNILDM